MADQAIKYLLDVVFGLFTYALLLRFVMQWLRAPFRNPLGQAVVALTDWIVKHRSKWRKTRQTATHSPSH